MDAVVMHSRGVVQTGGFGRMKAGVTQESARQQSGFDEGRLGCFAPAQALRSVARVIDMPAMCYMMSHMKSTTVRELRNNYSRVLHWVSKGEEVEVTRRGKVVAKVIPPSVSPPAEVDWRQSAALHRPAWSTSLTSEQSARILAESQGR